MSRPVIPPRLLRRIVLPGLGGTLVAVGAVACARAAADTPPAAEADAIPVLATEVRVGDAARTIVATGTTAGLEEVPLAFKIGGIVASIDARAGDRVAAGRVLASLQRTEIGAQVANADEAVAKAARDLARVEQLHRDSVATLEQLQDARTALAVARNGGTIARFNADNAVIRAPGGGIVLERRAEPGQVVEAGTPVLVLRRAGSGMIVRAALTDRDAVRIAAGDPATVRLDALPGRTFEGRVVRRGAAADRATGAYTVEIALGTDADALPSGLVAQVILAPRTAAAPRAATPVVPIEALVDADGDSAAVFVVRPDGRTVQRRVVRLLDVAEALKEARIPVADGVRAGERVVVGNTVRLTDGARITLTAAAAPAVADTPQWRTTP